MTQQALQAQFSGDTTENFNNGYIEYVINNREQSESLSTTTSQSASIVAEEISIVGANIFRGNGSSSQAIGAIDSSLDGTNGTLRINLLDPDSFANGSFEASSSTTADPNVANKANFPGWSIYNERIQLDGLSTILGYPTPSDSSDPANSSGTDNSTTANITYTSSISTAPSPASAGGGNAIQLSLSGISDSYGVIHGPYLVSEAAYISANSQVSFEWTAIAAGDAYDVYAYLINVDDGSTIELLNATGSSGSATSPWATATQSVATAGNYSFVFASGSFDFSGGTALGANLLVDSVSISQGTPQNPPISETNLEQLNSLINYFSSTQPTSDRFVDITAVESSANGSGTLIATYRIALQATPSSATQDAPTRVVDSTPIDPAPAGVNVQASDDDGDGIREVVTAADGTIVDGNRDGISDATQSQVAGLRLINDGAAGSDYGAISVGEGIQLGAVTLTSAAADGAFPVIARGGGTLVTQVPGGITNAFAGVVSFDASGLTPGGTTQATISIPSGLPAGTGNAYLRFNYATNRFEEFVDANGNPLYTFIDSDGDGTVDGVSLTLTDGDPNWDGDGVANGTVVDPGFFGSGERIITGTKRGDSLIGNVLANIISGLKGNDWLVGDLGNDILKGSRGKDGLYGGEGADLITGGKDRDRIYYTDASESTIDQRDTVKFGKVDRIVFSSFDGDSTTEGQQMLSFIGKQAFSGTAGELRATRSVLEADTNGDGLADFAVNLNGNALITASNLVL